MSHFPLSLGSINCAVSFKIAAAAVGLRFLYETIPYRGLFGDKPFAASLLLATLTAADLSHSMFPCVKVIDILTHIQRL
jgi:hypothetical protein